MQDADDFAEDRRVIAGQYRIARVAGDEIGATAADSVLLDGGFPSSIAATMSPLSATACCLTTMMSPSAMAASIMESPRTRSANSRPRPTPITGKRATVHVTSQYAHGSGANITVAPSDGDVTVSGAGTATSSQIASGTGSSVVGSQLSGYKLVYIGAYG